MNITPTSGMVERYATEFVMPVPYTTYCKALELACYFQNRCVDLTEIVEQFCLDADHNIGAKE